MTARKANTALVLAVVYVDMFGIRLAFSLLLRLVQHVSPSAPFHRAGCRL